MNTLKELVGKWKLRSNNVERIISLEASRAIDDCVSELEAAIALEKSPWVSVDEKFPEDSEVLFVKISNQYCKLGMWSEEDGWFDPVTDVELQNVTHYMIPPK